MRARLGEVEPGQRRAVVVGTSRTRDREAAARRRALDLDEVVQARRQRLPLLDVRRLAVGAGLAAAEDRGQRPRLDRDEPVRRRATRTTGAGTRTASRAGKLASPPPATTTCSVPTNAAIPSAGSSTSSSPTAPRVGVAAVRDRPERRLAVAPARGDDAACPGSRAASGVHSPVASSSAYRRCTGSIARSSALSRSFQPTQAPKTFSQTSTPTPFSQALCSSSRVVAVPAAGVVEHVPLLEPARPQHARDRAVGEPLRPREVVVADARERQRRLALERDPRPRRVERRPKPRLRLLHRVEEDAVGAELAHELRDRDVVGDRLAPRADVPRVVVDEDAQPARLQLGDELADPGHVAVEVELVAVVDPDHGIRVPEHDPVEAAELALRLGAEALRREAAGVVVVEQLVPEPGERDRRGSRASRRTPARA